MSCNLGLFEGFIRVLFSLSGQKWSK